MDPNFNTGDFGQQARSFGDTLLNDVVTWTPRVLAALVILVIGYLIARAVKWALATAINKTSLARRAHAHRNVPANAHRHPESLGAQLGGAGFWIVMLFALMAAAQPLGLNQATGPLGEMANQFGAAIPHVIGAALILFVGAIIASVAKKAVEALLEAANTERLFSRVGASSMDPTLLPRVVGGVVYALIIIPVAIAALEQLNIRSISEPATAMLRLVLDAIPLVIAAGIILALAVALGRFAGNLTTQFLQTTRFDSALGELGLSTGGASASASTSGRVSVSGGGGTSPSRLAGHAVTIAIILFGLMEAFRQLNFTYGSRMMAEILSLLGAVIFGSVIIAAGVIIARFVGQTVEAQGGGALGGRVTRIAIIVLASAIGLRFMGLADDIINLAFGLILGAVAVAAALAFGLGGRQAAGRLVEQITNEAGRSTLSGLASSASATTSAAAADPTRPAVNPNPTQTQL